MLLKIPLNNQTIVIKIIISSKKNCFKQKWFDKVSFIYPKKTAQTFLPQESLCLRLVSWGGLDYCHPHPLIGVSHKECQAF